MSLSQNNIENPAIQESRIAPTMPLPKRLLSYQISNLQGVGARERQEDSFTLANAFDVKQIKNNGLLFVVCDGMGGMKDGKVASETAIASIRQTFQYMNRSSDIAYQLKEGIYEAAEKVKEQLGGYGGSTVVAGIIYQEKLYFASVGDSFFYLKRGDMLYRLNEEHTMCTQIYRECIRDGNMDPAAGRNDSESSALTQFLGMVGLSEVDGFVKPLPLREGDVLLACSDGVGGVLNETEVLQALSCKTPQEMCSRIESGIVSHNRKHQDNYTAIIVKCVK
ncbi:MAG: serine/threonine-protein phosphatase [Lachnospiraceae bacterium]|nr:serine/threonine-protein phosphatase [Lachnospiraceae bacterium]